MQVRRYTLKPTWWTFITGLLLFGGGGAGMVHSSATNTRGLVIDWIVHLDPGEARWFYGVFGVLGLGCAVALVLAQIRFMGGKQQILVEDDAVIVPRTLGWPRQRSIRYSDIMDVHIQTYRRDKFLILVTRDGKAGIAKSRLEDAEFDEIVDIIAARVAPEISSLPKPEVRRERPLMTPPLHGPPRGVDSDPFRAPPAVELPVVMPDVESPPAPVVQDPDAPEPKSLR